MSQIIFTGPATRLGPNDITHAAIILGCDPAAVKAVCQVESSGGGFLPDTRPKILFEALKFHEFTDGNYDDSHPNISSPEWDQSLYGPGGVHQYDRLFEAMALDEESALKSASWGMFQIMGGNSGRCGFVAVRDMVAAMIESEGAQLDAFAAFVASDHLMLTALQSQNWATFARLYNGRSYAKNQYDVKLAAAFNKAKTL
jgi:N-acetylmuramidase